MIVATETVSVDAVAQDQIRAFVERIERMEEEKASVAADIKEIFAEAKGNGFDTKALRRVIKLRKMDQGEREQQDALVDLYMVALGMIPAPIEHDGKSPLESLRELAEKDGGATISVIHGGKETVIAGRPKSNPVGFDHSDDV